MSPRLRERNKNGSHSRSAENSHLKRLQHLLNYFTHRNRKGNQKCFFESAIDRN